MTTSYDAMDEDAPPSAVALSPVSFVERAAEVHGGLTAIVHGRRRQDWRSTRERVARLAAALQAAGIGPGDTVSLLLADTPEAIEAHYAVPAVGAVVHALDPSLGVDALTERMAHGETALLLCDRAYAAIGRQVLAQLQAQQGRVPLVVDVHDSEWPADAVAARLSAVDYEAWLAAHAPLASLSPPVDERAAIALNHVGGDRRPLRGVVTHHRGACLKAVCNALTWSLPLHPVFLWTLPLHQANGWGFVWTLALQAGTHVCLRSRDPRSVLQAMRQHQVTHFCALPDVHEALLAVPQDWRIGLDRPVRSWIGGAPVEPALLDALVRAGFDVTQVYGLTETGGPAAVTVSQPGWAAESLTEQVRLCARQGVRQPLQEGLAVCDPLTLRPVACDGRSVGEVMFRGNLVMKGYLKDPQATRAALAGGWLRTGDLAVREPDGHIRLVRPDGTAGGLRLPAAAAVDLLV
jgi:fatty-acyl-CoA synthase